MVVCEGSGCPNWVEVDDGKMYWIDGVSMKSEYDGYRSEVEEVMRRRQK